jgi:glycosyltransferase involved in cell wall biosynthesis
MPRLAIVRPSSSILDLDAYNVQELGLGKALCDLGWNVDLYLRGRVASMTCGYKHQDQKLRIFSLNGFGLPGQQGIFPEIFNRLNQTAYDLIQVHEDSQVTSLFCAMWAKNKNVPVILYQGMYEPYSGIKGVFQGCFNALAVPIYKRTLSCCLSKTTAAKGYLGGLGLSPVHVLPVGLDVTSLEGSLGTEPESLARFRKRFQKVLLYVGVFTPRRNPHFLIRLFHELTRTHDVGLVLVGEGPDRESALELARKLGVAGRILAESHVPQNLISHYYRAADLFLLPSQYEIYGMVLLEALNFGLPVVSSRTAGAEAILKDESLGILMGTYDLRKWLTVCVSFFDEQQSAKKIRIAHVREQLSWETIARKYAEIFQGLGCRSSGSHQ